VFRQQPPAQQREQGRLPDAIAPNDADAMPGVERQVQMLEQCLSATLERDVVNDDHDLQTRGKAGSFADDADHVTPRNGDRQAFAGSTLRGCACPDCGPCWR